MKTLTRRLRLALLLTAFALALPDAPARAASLLLDNFQDGPFTLTAATGVSTGSDQPAAGAAGGYRAETLFNPLAPPNGPAVATATLIAAGGGITVNSGYLSFSLAYGQRYNGGSSTIGNAGTALNVDLTGTDRIRLNLTAVTGTVRLYATLGTLNGGTLNNGNSGDPVFTFSGGGIVDLPYSQLRTPGGGAASGYNLSDVDFITLNFQPQPGAGFTLASVAIVPEPAASTCISVMGALAALHCVQRRRRGRAAN